MRKLIETVGPFGNFVRRREVLSSGDFGNQTKQTVAPVSLSVESMWRHNQLRFRS